MGNLVIFHPGGIGDCILDISILHQLIKSDNAPKNFKYVCNEDAKPIIEISGLDKHIDIFYLKYPIININNLFTFLEIRGRKQKIFVLAGVNLKNIGYLKLLWPNDVKFYGTLECYPDECMKKMRPNSNMYSYIEGPFKNSHRIVENFKLFKNQGLLDKSDFIIKGLDKAIVNNLAPFVLVLKKVPYIVIHTSHYDVDAKKSMNINYWRDLLIIINKRVNKKVVIIGSAKEKMSVEAMMSKLDSEKIINACGTNLHEVIQIISGSKLVLAVDGGMSHLAAALGKKLITIFGPTNSFNVSPVDTQGIILSKRLACSPCYWGDNYYKCPYDRKCLNEIDKNLIVDLVLEIMAGINIENKIIKNSYINNIPSYECLRSFL